MNALRLLSAASLAASLPVVAALMMSESSPVDTAVPTKLSGTSAVEVFVTEPKAGQIAVHSLAKALPVKHVLSDGITEVVLARGPLLTDAPILDAPIIEASSGSNGLSQPLPTTTTPPALGVAASFQTPQPQQANSPALRSQAPLQSAQLPPLQLPALSAPAQSTAAAAPAAASAVAATPPVAAVPLPAGGLLLLTALGGAIALRRRAKR